MQCSAMLWAIGMCLYTKVANGDITIRPLVPSAKASGTNFNSCVHRFGLTVQCGGIRDTTGTEIETTTCTPLQ